jgi:23S rRNA (cytidine1920-2'-O)/16S rRNA (cytidine1409-2'-O)-methyltransferase
VITPHFVSRAGEKLQFALTSFKFSTKGLICADFGSSTGGFVDCLLQNGATKVYSVDTAYGELAWNLRNDKRVVVLERNNAMHVALPEKVDLISIDCGWTRQKLVLPNAINNLKENGTIISLIKPHYEADPKDIVKGKLKEEMVAVVLEKVKKDIEGLGLTVNGMVKSPIEGARAKNDEYLMLLTAN